MSTNKPKWSISKWFAQEFKITILLLRSIPSAAVALFVVSVITMNLLANKTIFQNDWIAIDGGILVSWLSFLSMDVVTKHFGPKASTRMSVFAILVNLLTCLIFFLVSIIPTNEDYSKFNEIIGGTWFILLSSTIAFIISGILNNYLNYFTNKLFKKNDKVLQLKNDSEKEIMNGDIGKIIDIGKIDEKDVMFIEFDGRVIPYYASDIENLTLAYCMSIHKAQGSEFDNVIMPILPSYQIMLKKKII